MSEVANLKQSAQQSPEHVDVLIVGAGISGIGAAHHLSEKCPDKSYMILESKPSFGGTWRQHTYPGIRSDSDLHTFGYGFKPWTGRPIAEGGAILEYLEEAIAADQIGLQRDFLFEVLQVLAGGAFLAGNNFVTGAVVADIVAERDVQIERNRLNAVIEFSAVVFNNLIADTFLELHRRRVGGVPRTAQIVFCDQGLIPAFGCIVLNC